METIDSDLRAVCTTVNLISCEIDPLLTSVLLIHPMVWLLNSLSLRHVDRWQCGTSLLSLHSRSIILMQIIICKTIVLLLTCPFSPHPHSILFRTPLIIIWTPQIYVGSRTSRFSTGLCPRNPSSNLPTIHIASLIPNHSATGHLFADDVLVFINGFLSAQFIPSGRIQRFPHMDDFKSTLALRPNLNSSGS